MGQLLEKDNLGKDFAQTALGPEVVGVRLWHIVRVVGQVLGRVGITVLVQLENVNNITKLLEALDCIQQPGHCY